MLNEIHICIAIALGAAALIGIGWSAAVRFNGYVRRDQCQVSMDKLETRIINLADSTDNSFRRIHERLDDLQRCTARISGWVEAQDDVRRKSRN